MRSSISSDSTQGKRSSSRASAILLALVSLHHASAQAQIEQVAPNNPAITASAKYQKLLDAGIFSSNSTPSNLDATMTRAELAAVITKLQTLNTQSASTSYSGVDPALGVVPIMAKTIEGISSTNELSAATMADVISALGKAGILGQTELNQLAEKLKANSADAAKTGGVQTVQPAVNIETIRTVNNAAETIVVPDVVPAMAIVIGGTSIGTEATLSLALAAAAALAASSAANNIALENATLPGADYTVVLPRNNWPTNLSATYSGRLNGTLSDNSLVGGNLSMNVNFATIRNAAAIPGSVLFDNGKGSATLNLVQFNGFVGGGMNGTYNGQAMTGNIINGQFYGPAAEAVKGSWSMATPAVTGGGVFSATR